MDVNNINIFDNIIEYKSYLNKLIDLLNLNEIDNRLINNEIILYPFNYLEDIDNKTTCIYYKLFFLNNEKLTLEFNEDLKINNEQELIEIIKLIKSNSIENINWDYPNFYFHREMDED